ncbi:MAG: methyltransferase domain-containing protein [Deltaproteobacteria bacterium]|nr:methyltransferase domain-containing protein [Deltaproteobacteria bacterium]
MNRANEGDPGTEASLSGYYAALTDPLVKFSGDLRMWHFGLWGPDTANEQEALLRSNRTLAHGCGLAPGRQVLDAGCGVGGTAIAMAESYGVRVTGLTNCEPHLAVATEHARRRGVGHLVEFRHGDFMDLPFPDDSFDAVLNHESFCYAPDKLAYLRGVHRVLKPGGRWQALEGLLSGTPLSEEQEAVHVSMQRGFHMPPLASWRDVLATLEQAGFEGMRERDLASEVAPSTEETRKRWLLFVFMSPRPRPEWTAYHEFMGAAVDFDRGLRDGAFTYRLVSGAKPAR